MPPPVAPPPNAEELVVFGLLAPNPLKVVPPLVAVVLPNRPPLLVVLAPKAGLAVPNGVEAEAPNPAPVGDGQVSVDSGVLLGNFLLSLNNSIFIVTFTIWRWKAHVAESPRATAQVMVAGLRSSSREARSFVYASSEHTSRSEDAPASGVSSSTEPGRLLLTEA